MTELLLQVSAPNTIAQYYKEYYDSLPVQFYKNWAAIIVDDGSIDDSLSVLKIYLDKIHFRFY